MSAHNFHRKKHFHTVHNILSVQGKQTASVIDGGENTWHWKYIKVQIPCIPTAVHTNRKQTNGNRVACFGSSHSFKAGVPNHRVRFYSSTMLKSWIKIKAEYLEIAKKAIKRNILQVSLSPITPKWERLYYALYDALLRVRDSRSMENCLTWNWYVVQKRLESAALKDTGTTDQYQVIFIL